ncbi:RNA polymerase sigma-70 factor [Dyadobacter chenwenxiniae]|uniref:RNA polymerase sigma-70 factor n=1 Tax=Dyadobacter chenwenxiniae TaxID=2906456 RepID=A0A9X1TK18_9BACT|nr:RNA polymerase sigma-70 factor [Dyadobacter chenwenxiniae]MCF0060748.1 RNA polymerase sigma-70 factor [Dyadobacter chenwenxiniae]UON80582.1 RNA polymerase sigma-70 factor [Dyadobacter chenwenxiniae]
MTTPLPGNSEDQASRGNRSPFSFANKTPIHADDERLLREAFAVSPKDGCSLLFRRYYVTLCNHAVRFVHSREIAEDIVSELFETFWQNRIFEQVESSYRAYLYKAVRHRTYNYIRWQLDPTDPLESMDFSPVAQTVSPDEAMQYTELYLKVESIIQDLPPQCRRAYIMKRVEGKKYDEIAKELQISPKAVEGLVSRALLKLRTGLKESWFLTLLLPILF